jgi:aconitate hydratase
VGGIEAEAVMLGQPISMLLPHVIGMKVTGHLPPGTNATDLALAVTQKLRKEKVVGKFVEFFGPGLDRLGVPDRATIANMAPEQGSTCSFFPVDAKTLDYLRMTNRSPALIQRIEAYGRAQGLFRTTDTPDPDFYHIVELDLAEVETSVAGPSRPQDQVPISKLKTAWQGWAQTPKEQGGFGLGESTPDSLGLDHGAVVIAAITSCTNTSNPSVMLGAGLLAKKACELGLSVKSYVKTSLAPGSKVVTRYLESTGLLPYLERLGFYVVGYGCTTCIGNSGPLAPHVAKSIDRNQWAVAAVLSGNRNFEGRIHAKIKASFLASPLLVVAYALAGRIQIDFATEAMGVNENGQEIMLADVWPTEDEIQALLAQANDQNNFTQVYSELLSQNPTWNKISAEGPALYPWNESSTYIQEPPFFIDVNTQVPPVASIEQARVLLLLGDSVTTDHISPAGNIPDNSPAGRYLLQQGVASKDFNSYGSRRGNDRVMTRGTFANTRIRNALAQGKEGGYTTHRPSGELLDIYTASQRYKAGQTPTLVIAGSDYGMGSSRDWAAKGTYLLGIRAVLAVSFERIHRSNLIGMGVLPLQFLPDQNASTLELTGHETFDIHVDESLIARQQLEVKVSNETGQRSFWVQCRIDTDVELVTYKNGGILHRVLRQLISKDTQP